MSGVRLLDYWSPPEGAGDAVAVLATTFTFEPDFFTQDCLARFLKLSAVMDGDDPISTIAALIEEEDRLNEAQVSVLIDRSSPVEKRNLRWDILPVTVPGGLLHAKVAVLLWERATRIVLGSANLTSAGYRRQVETAVAFDLRPDCKLPRSLLDDFLREVRALFAFVPDAAMAAKERALVTLDLLQERVDALDLPVRQSSDLRLAIAPAYPGHCPLDQLDEVWQGPRPLRAAILSPFWDGHAPSPAISAVRARLTGRPADGRSCAAVIARDPMNGMPLVPESIAEETDLSLIWFEPPEDEEYRTLHAKVLVMESDQWRAAMMGSSNATVAGYGLGRKGHRELNLWIGCPIESREAGGLLELLQQGEEMDVEEITRWDPLPDEDLPTAEPLPKGFVWCSVRAGVHPQLTLTLDVSDAFLKQYWQILLPSGRVIYRTNDWDKAGNPETVCLPLETEELPSYLAVTWWHGGEQSQASWAVNIEDRAALPPPKELAELPVEVLISALAASRPLPAAIEYELRRRAKTTQNSTDSDLDPLKRFDSSHLLLQRTRELSFALWRLEQRLARPFTSIEVLRWRLHGALGPIAIADGVLAAAQQGRSLPGEGHFLMAELALLLSAVDWKACAPGLDASLVSDVVAEVVSRLRTAFLALPPAEDASLRAYVEEAFAEVMP